MQSAYAILGIPLDASAEEIEEAFERACARFPRERLELEPGAAQKLAEIRKAYVALQSPDVKAQHGLWLASRAAELASRPVPLELVDASRRHSNVRLFFLVVMSAVLATAILGYKGTEARREEAALARQIQMRKEREQQEERAQEAREAERQKVRRMCIQLYGRPDC